MDVALFSARLREAMDARGLRQVDVLNLAKESGQKLGKSQLSQYVSGKTAPRRAVLGFLAEALEVEPGWLSGADAHADSPSPCASASSGAATATNAAAAMAAGTDSATATTPAASRHENQKGSPMRTFKKSSKLDNVLYDVRGPVLEEAMRMEASGTTVLKLNIGNPAPFDFRTPDEVVRDMARQLPDCEGYSDSKGLFSARKAIQQYYQLRGIEDVHTGDIYTGNGVSELVNICMSALLDSGDEILIPSPDYPLWTACATLAGGTPVHYVCDEQADWCPDLDDIRSKITDRTKAIVIINPNNPTGALYPKELLEEVVEIARQHQLIIFSDEIYDRLVMDDLEHVSTASLAPDLFCVTFSGLSKSHMIAGYRVGWMVLSGNKKVAEDYIEGLNMLSNMRLCSNVPGQSIVQTALWGHQSVKNYVVPGGRIRDQRDFVYEALNAIPGVSAAKPKAAFYIFPKLDPQRYNIHNDEQFALDFLRKKKVLIVPGSGFNWHTPGHFRVVYLPRRAVLRDAMEKLEEFLSTYRQ